MKRSFIFLNEFISFLSFTYSLDNFNINFQSDRTLIIFEDMVGELSSSQFVSNLLTFSGILEKYTDPLINFRVHFKVLSGLLLLRSAYFSTTTTSNSPTKWYQCGHYQSKSFRGLCSLKLF